VFIYCFIFSSFTLKRKQSNEFLFSVGGVVLVVAINFEHYRRPSEDPRIVVSNGRTGYSIMYPILPVHVAVVQFDHANEH